MSELWPYIVALIPSIGVGILFWIVIKNMLEGDRKERLAHSQWLAQQEKEPSRQEKQTAKPEKHTAADQQKHSTEHQTSPSAERGDNEHP